MGIDLLLKPVKDIRDRLLLGWIYGCHRPIGQFISAKCNIISKNAEAATLFGRSLFQYGQGPLAISGL